MTLEPHDQKKDDEATEAHCNKHQTFNDECPWCHAVANESIDWTMDERS